MVAAMKNNKAGQKALKHYTNESLFEGLSYYKMVGETYHSRRLKKKMHRSIERFVKNSSQKTFEVLDIGCDTGTDLFMFPKIADATFHRTGTDVSAGAISQAQNLAKKRGEKDITFKVADANKKQPFKDNSFDIITSSELIEHIEDPVYLLNEMHRLLKPGGIAVISTPNEKSFQKFLMQKVLPKSMEKNLDDSRSVGFTRHGANTKLDHADWDEEAHISIYGAKQWQGIVKKSKLNLKSMTGSAFYGGMPAFEDYPFVMGAMMILDSIIDILPSHPHFQTCVIMTLQKEN